MPEPQPKFRIRVGCIEVEAPTAKEVIELFDKVSHVKIKYPLDEAVR